MSSDINEPYQHLNHPRHAPEDSHSSVEPKLNIQARGTISYALSYSLKLGPIALIFALIIGSFRFYDPSANLANRSTNTAHQASPTPFISVERAGSAIVPPAAPAPQSTPPLNLTDSPPAVRITDEIWLCGDPDYISTVFDAQVPPDQTTFRTFARRDGQRYYPSQQVVGGIHPDGTHFYQAILFTGPLGNYDVFVVYLPKEAMAELDAYLDKRVVDRQWAIGLESLPAGALILAQDRVGGHCQNLENTPETNMTLPIQTRTAGSTAFDSAYPVSTRPQHK